MKYSLFAIIFLVIGGYFYYIPSSTLDSYQTIHEAEVEIVQCPSEENFSQVWNNWSKDFLVENPDAGDTGLMEGWKALMATNGCSDEWLDRYQNASIPYSTTTPPGSTVEYYQY